jgi:hypothetical protein
VPGSSIRDLGTRLERGSTARECNGLRVFLQRDAPAGPEGILLCATALPIIPSTLSLLVFCITNKTALTRLGHSDKLALERKRGPSEVALPDCTAPLRGVEKTVTRTLNVHRSGIDFFKSAKAR